MTLVKVELSKNQKQKLIIAKKKGIPVRITLHAPFGEGEEIFLTNRQIAMIEKVKPKGKRITLSVDQLNQSGGFLSAILPILTKTVLPALGTLGLSAASGAISGAVNKATRGQNASGLYRVGDGLYQTGNGINIIMTKNDIKKILEIIGELENNGLVEKNSLNKAMKEIKAQKGGFIGTLLAGLAGSLLPALFGK